MRTGSIKGDQMTSTNNNNYGPGLLGLCTLATIILAVLKLAGVISITWLIVFLPLIIGGAVTAVLIVLALIMFAISALIINK